MDIILMPGQHAGLGGFEPWTIVFLPATLPLRYTLQPKSLARKAVDIQVNQA